MAKKFLILTAGYGEGHNSAARGLQAALARVAPDASVELHDLFAETYAALHHWVRKGYLGLINSWPRSWGFVYRWLDRKSDFHADFRRFARLRRTLEVLLARFQPEVVVSVFPAYPYLIESLTKNGAPRSVAIVTDSITVNAIWYRSEADCFILPNDQSADVLRRAGIAESRIKVFGFPVDPGFADLARRDPPSSQNRPRVLYMINAATGRAAETARRLSELDVQLTVTVGRDEKLRREIEAAVTAKAVEIIGWCSNLPELLCRSHLLIGKAGGATVQEAIAAACPMLINHIVSGQEEGNAQLLMENGGGLIVRGPSAIAQTVSDLFANDSARWRQMSVAIGKISRPAAAFDIANYLLSL